MFTVTSIPGLEPTVLPPLWGRTVGSTPGMLVTVNIVGDLGRFWQKEIDLRENDFSAKIGQNVYRNQHPCGRTDRSTTALGLNRPFYLSSGAEPGVLPPPRLV